MEKTPKVSVIIPNYNYARFLKKRIQSVLDQTYQNFEVLYFDDASTDNSVAIVEKFATADQRIEVFKNTVNSGNVFTLWNKGAREARGEYLWIAEADDYADPQLLESLVNKLDEHPTAGLAYCQSWTVDEHDHILGKFDELWTADLDPERWKHDFINNGEDECRNYAILKNTIPNASAALVRRTVYQAVGGATEDMRLSGDWLTWAKVLFASDVVYISKPLNYFRTHGATYRSRHSKNGVFIQEAFRVIDYISQQTNVTEETLKKAFCGILHFWIDYALMYNFPLTKHCEIYGTANTVNPMIKWLLLKEIFLRFQNAAQRTFEPIVRTIRMRLKVRIRIKNLYNKLQPGKGKMK